MKMRLYIAFGIIVLFIVGVIIVSRSIPPESTTSSSSPKQTQAPANTNQSPPNQTQAPANTKQNTGGTQTPSQASSSNTKSQSAAAFAASSSARPATAGSSYILPPSTQLAGAAYGNGVYVLAVSCATGAAPYGYKILTSTDGATWTVQPSVDKHIEIEDIVYGNGVFVAVGRMSRKSASNVGAVLTSSDGVHWSVNNFDITFYKVAYGTGKFVLLGDHTNYVSTDGVNWTPVPADNIVVGGTGTDQFIYGNGVFAYFVGTTFITSTDGVNWQSEDMGLIDWSTYAAPIFYPVILDDGAVYGGGMYAVVGTYTPTPSGSPYPFVITSRDGVKWTTTKLNEPFSRWNGIAYGNGTFMANAADGSILTSSDGLAWTLRNTGANTCYRAVFFCHDRFVALDNDGTIFTSKDGVNWVNRREVKY